MQESSQSFELINGMVWKVLIKFAFPIFLSTIFQALYTMTDAFIIGQFAGTDMLAAIDSVYNVIKFPLNFFTGLSSGATIIVSQYYGAKDLDKVSEVSHNAVLFSLCGGLLISVLGVFLSSFFIDLLNVPKNIAYSSNLYLVIYFTGMIFSLFYNMGAGIIRALGNSKIPFYLLIVSNVINIVLDLIFIKMFQMGVSGAALATIISQFVCAILIFFILLKTTLPCKIRIIKIHFQGKYIKEIFKLGIPIGMQFVLFPISNMVVQSSINSFGVDSIAAWAVCGKLDFLIWSVLEALSVAVSVFIAQNYGAGKYKRVKRGVNFGILTGVVIIGSISFILYFHSIFLASLLIKKQSAILIVGSIMNFIAPFYVMAVFFEILSSAIRGMGESVRPMIITLITTCFFRIFWIMFIVPLKSSLFLTLSCYPLSWFIASISFIVCYLLILRKDRILHLSI